MFILPMLGRSTRFYSAGYKLPKYKLPLGNSDRLLIDWVLLSFNKYFHSDLFVLICRRDSGDELFLRKRLRDLGVINFKVIVVDGETRGQAESVSIGLDGLTLSDELFIFNIDTFLYNFDKWSLRHRSTGYLEVFKGEGNHWSFVKPSSADSDLAESVVEKVRVSDLCSNGLYYFASVQEYLLAYSDFQRNPIGNYSEQFVAPLYNSVIQRGGLVRFRLIPFDEIGFSGTPSEYLALQSNLSLVR